MLNIDELKKRYTNPDDKKYFSPVEAEYVCKITKILGFEANEEKNKLYPTWITNLEILQTFSDHPDANQPGDICFVGYKLSDKRQINHLEAFCNAANQELSNQIFDNETTGIKGSINGQIIRVKTQMKDKWINLYFSKQNQPTIIVNPEPSQYAKNTYGESKIYVSNDLKDTQLPKKTNTTWYNPPEPQQTSTWGPQKSTQWGKY